MTNQRGLSARVIDRQPPRLDDELNYSGKDMDDNKLHVMSEFFMRSNKATVLNLNNNKITSTGFKFLVNKLYSHPSFEKVTLDSNNLDGEAIQCLFNNIGQKFRSVKHFVLTNNRDLMKASHNKKIKTWLVALREKNIKIDI